MLTYKARPIECCFSLLNPKVPKIFTKNAMLNTNLHSMYLCRHMPKNSLTGGIREEMRKRFLNEGYGEFFI